MSVLSYWIVAASVPAVVLISLLLLWVSLRIIRRTSAGRYWIAVWIPMGWLASLALVEWLASSLVGYRQILARYQQVPLTDLQPFHILWAVAFAMVLVGFIPRLRPRTRSDRLNLVAFSLCWMGFMLLINICWIGFMIFVSFIG